MSVFPAMEPLVWKKRTRSASDVSERPQAITGYQLAAKL